MNKKEYKELVDFLGRRFDEIDHRFDEIDKRFNTVPSGAEVEGIVERVSERKKNELMGMLDAYAKRADDQWQEHQVLAGQTRRHQEWLEDIAKKLGMKLRY